MRVKGWPWGPWLRRLEVQSCERYLAPPSFRPGPLTLALSHGGERGLLVAEGYVMEEAGAVPSTLVGGDSLSLDG